MTLKEIITEVTNRLHDTGSDVTARVRSWVLLAYQDVINRAYWPWLDRNDTIRTTSGTQDYGLSGEVDMLLDIRDSFGQAKLEQITWQELDTIVPNPTATSPPVAYIPNGILGVKDQLGTTASTVAMNSTSATDGPTTVSVVIYGIRRGAYDNEVVLLNGTASTQTVNTWSRIDKIVKVQTSVGVIRAFAETASAGLALTFSTISPQEYSSEYPHIGIYPTGATTLSYRFKKRVLQLANTADVPEIPMKWHEVLVWGALMRGAEFMSKESLPMTIQQYEAMIERMIETLMPTIDWRPTVESDAYPLSRPLVRISRTAS